MTLIPRTDLDVFPLCLGGNVFGWTAAEQESFEVLDAYAAAGGNFIDTADMYGSWMGSDEDQWSESIIGRWMAVRRVRATTVLATQIGTMPGREGLTVDKIVTGVEASLRRLRTDYIDLLYVHRDDLATSVAETVSALHSLVSDGKVRFIGASNMSADRLVESLDASRGSGVADYVAVQPLYNLLERESFEAELAPVCIDRVIGCMPYASLARGFLTGKYRPGGPAIESHYADRASSYLDQRGVAVLATLDEISAAHSTTVPAVALAWLLSRPTVVSPIASARTPGQLDELLPAVALRIGDDEMKRLNDVSRW
jgi:aryl-alcohol dehydrogenase-like predicted oxidoreductase